MATTRPPTLDDRSLENTLALGQEVVERLQRTHAAIQQQIDRSRRHLRESHEALRNAARAISGSATDPAPPPRAQE
jgi:uncharacterized coiled-coil protein SlyX